MFTDLLINNTKVQDLTLPQIPMDKWDDTTWDPVIVLLTQDLVIAQVTQDISLDSDSGSDWEFLNA